MEIPNLKLYGFTDVLDRASMDDKKRYFYVDSHEHIAVVSKLADKILATQDELIKAYNEIIALKTTLGNSMSKVGP